MKIIAFDLARKTGCAIGDASASPICHTEVLGEVGSRHGIKFAQVLYMTKRLILEHKPDFVVIEKPIATGVAGSENRVQLAMGYRACVMASAHLYQVKFHHYDVQDIRRHFIGRGDLRRDPAKAAVMRRCKQLGWNVSNDDEADACAVWDYARSRLANKSTMPQGGLFDDGNTQF